MIAQKMLSPSLESADETPAFELKFRLTEEAAQAVADWARRRLALDGHADPARGYTYRITSLYCDTPDWDVYRRNLSFARQKFRLRRYGSEPWLFLERKRKWGDQVRKQRTRLEAAAAAARLREEPFPGWEGHWFHERVAARRLGPVCQIHYDRMAFVGLGADGPLRLTLDHNLHGSLHGDWLFGDGDNGLSLLSGERICELKFRAAVPALFKELIGELRLTPRPVSKYRLFVEAWGGVPPRGEGDG
jgi:hypothetical protein